MLCGIAFLHVAIPRVENLLTRVRFVVLKGRLSSMGFPKGSATAPLWVDGPGERYHPGAGSGGIRLDAWGSGERHVALGRGCNERQRCHQHHPVDPAMMLI